MNRTQYKDIDPFVTKDGSTVRELFRTERQSLAEATVAPGTETFLHRHITTEELYHITAGEGMMILGDEEFSVAAGDTILIPPDTLHRIRNTGAEALHILCCCAPPYAHDDTEMG